MTSYLQRIASSVVAPPTRLRPLVGSVFSPEAPVEPGDQSGGDISETESLIGDAAQGNEPFNPRGNRSPASMTSESLPSHHFAEAPADRSASVETRQAKAANANLRPHQTDVVAPLITKKHAFAASASSERADQTEAVDPEISEQKAPVDSGKYQALFAATAQALDEESDSASMVEPAELRTPQTLQPAWARSSQNGNGPRASRKDSQREPREPDEVQIHIGRIEVTAVPPPVQQRTPKPRPKGLGLDEYLKRHGGRGL